MILHPGWEENNRPDLAHIKLDRSIQRIQPVPLYKRIDEIVKQMIIAGIGEYGTGKTGVEGNSGIMCAATNVVDSTKDDAYFLYR